MYWNDDSDQKPEDVIPDNIVDVNFKIKCPHLPLDHAHQLSTAVIQELPWIENDKYAGIHLIHGAESGNGWIRPSNPDELIYPSRRTLFTIRTPQEFIDDVKQLDGKSLQICDTSLEFSKPSIRKLSRLTTLFARYMLAEQVENEEKFLSEMADLLSSKNIKPKKMMSGRATTLTFPDEIYHVRSLMIDGIDVHESIQLQEEGLGDGRNFGCGLFLPHKGIDAVGDAQEK